MERLEQSVDLSYHVLYGLGVLQAQEVSDFGSLPLRQWGPDQVLSLLALLVQKYKF